MICPWRFSFQSSGASSQSTVWVSNTPELWNEGCRLADELCSQKWTKKKPCRFTAGSWELHWQAPLYKAYRKEQNVSYLSLQVTILHCRFTPSWFRNETREPGISKCSKLTTRYKYSKFYRSLINALTVQCLWFRVIPSAPLSPAVESSI